MSRVVLSFLVEVDESRGMVWTESLLSYHAPAACQILPTELEKNLMHNNQRQAKNRRIPALHPVYTQLTQKCFKILSCCMWPGPDCLMSPTLLLLCALVPISPWIGGVG